MERILEQLVAAGYERVAQVATRGQFAVRGGIVDLYSWQVPLPVRLEFLGDQIDSVRDLRSADILLGAPDDQGGLVRDYVGPDHLTFDIEPDKSSNANIQISED